jgi:hypothetical protein
MTGRGVSDSDMPDFARSSSPPAPGFHDETCSALLAGTALPADAPAPLQHVANVMAALRAGSAADELAGQARALAEFRRRVGGSRGPHRFRIRRPAVLSPIVTAVAVAVVCLGGFAIAGYARALPPSAQRLAHETIRAPSGGDGAPAARHPSTPAGSGSSRQTGSGRCAARSHPAKHSDARPSQTSGRGDKLAARPGPCAGAHPARGRNSASDHPDSEPEHGR